MNTQQNNTSTYQRPLTPDELISMEEGFKENDEVWKKLSNQLHEMEKFKVIIRRSDIKKAEDLCNKGKIHRIIFDRKDEWSVCYSMITKEKTTEGHDTYWHYV
jgi:hypothetical protein